MHTELQKEIMIEHWNFGITADSAWSVDLRPAEDTSPHKT